MAGVLTPEIVFYAACSVVLAASLAALLVVRPEAGLLLVGLAMALTLNLRFSRDSEARALAIQAGGLSVSLLDVLAILMLVVAAFRRLWRGAVEPWELLTWLMVVLTGANALRGLQEFPLERVLNELRPWLYLWAALLFTGSVRLTGRMRRALAAGLLAYAAWLVAAAVVGFAQTGLNAVTATVYIGGELVDPRPVAASGALVLAEALLMVVAVKRRLRRLVWLVAVLTVGLVVVLLQHRTIWIATVIALGYVVGAAAWKGGRGRVAAVGTAVAGVVLVATTVTTGLLRQTVLAGSASNALGQDNTLSWRVLGWQQLIGGDRDLLDVVLGAPFGRGFFRVVNEVTLTVSAHSQYVATYLRLGVVGLAVTGWLLLLAWRGAPAAARRLGASPLAVRGVVILVALYGATYSWDPFQGVVLGLLIALSRPTSEPVPAGGTAGRGMPPSPRPAALAVPARRG